MFDNVPPIVSVLMLPIVLLLFCFAMLVPFGIIIATYLIAETLYYSKYRNMVVPYEKEVLHKILTDIDERYSNLDKNPKALFITPPNPGASSLL